MQTTRNWNTWIEPCAVCVANWIWHLWQHDPCNLAAHTDAQVEGLIINDLVFQSGVMQKWIEIGETNWKPCDCNCGLSRFENAKSGSLLCIGLDVKVHEDPTWAANCRELASFSHNLCSALPPPCNPMSLWDKVKKLSCLDNIFFQANSVTALQVEFVEWRIVHLSIQARIIIIHPHQLQPKHQLCATNYCSLAAFD